MNASPAAARSAPAQSEYLMAAAIPTIRFAVISEGVYSWPLYVAQAHGLFAREGVNVDATVTGSSTLQLEKLTRGEYDIGMQQSDHVVRGVEHGSDLFIFMAQALAPELTLVAAPGIKSFADLKGRDIAVDGARTGYALLLRKLLADQGLADGDYAFREIGGLARALRFAEVGRDRREPAQSAVRPQPVRRGFCAAWARRANIFRRIPARSPRRGAVGPRATKPPPCSPISARFDAAYAWLKDTRNKEDAIRLLPVRLNIDPATAARAYDQIASQPLPHISPDGLRQVIAIVWASEGLSGAPAAPEKYMDLSYLNKVRNRR